MSDVCINRIVIHSKGDKSVGLFSATWTIDGPIYIDPDYIIEFTKKMAEAWEFIAEDAEVACELQGTCLNCGKLETTIQPPDQYEGWCVNCARLDAMADSDAYDYRTEQIENGG